MDSVGMNRRSFLKILGISAAVLAVDPMSAISKLGYSHFNPRKEYGEVYKITDFVDKHSVEHFIKELDKDVVEVVPPAYRSKVRWIVDNPKPMKSDPLAQRGQIGWLYSPRPQKQKVTFI